MENLTEIRWHGRGGQGAITASKLLATAAGESNYYVQAFPEYGAERMGAPVQSFNRISKHPIKIHCQIKTPDFVLVLDETLIKSINVTEGIKEGGIIIINTPKNSKEVKNLIKTDNKNIKVYTVDATKVSIDTIGKPIPNTPMIGALVKLIDFLELEPLLKVIKKILSKKFNNKTTQGNLNAIIKAYKEVKV